MCGICGLFNFKQKKNIDPEIIQRMMNAMHHRGPDDEGTYFSENLGFGFRRLSIIDLEGGKQPMTDETKSVWVIFNGEIYNFKSIKRQLENKGYKFQTRSDTEVIVHGYKEWGENVLSYLNGMFGLAIYDVKRQKLVIARDRMGIKLVYYSINDHMISFASEIKPLLECDGIDKTIDMDGIKSFLRYRYTPSPNTIYKNIKKLSPGEMLIVEKGKINTKKWYQYKPIFFDPMPTIQQAEEQLLMHYKEAVERHLISDVKVGLLLSGGIDSSLLLALMKLFGENWSTYTVGYGDEFKDDELSDASYTAKILGVENHQVRIDRSVFENTLNDVIKYLEEPIASSSVVPMYHVCQRAKEDVKVALIGQGPDELFGGYTRHYGATYGNLWRQIPSPLRNQIKKLLIKIPRKESIKRGVYSLDENDKINRLKKILSILPEEQINNLFIHNNLKNNSIEKNWESIDDLTSQVDELTSLNYVEVNSTLPDELLMYADKLSMAHSIELRVPYLDYTIVEYVLNLNASFKVRYGKRKYLHKKISSSLLPKQIINRKKRGFAVNVVDNWFRSSMANKFSNFINDPQSLIYKYLKHHEILELNNQHIAGKQDNYKILYSIICLEEWLRTYT